MSHIKKADKFMHKAYITQAEIIRDADQSFALEKYETAHRFWTTDDDINITIENNKARADHLKAIRFAGRLLADAYQEFQQVKSKDGEAAAHTIDYESWYKKTVERLKKVYKI